MRTPRRKALIVVDVQNDFCEGGSLAVEGGAQVAADITNFVNERANDLYDTIIFTRDWHEDPGEHWSDNPDFEVSFPHHCEAGTPGAELHPNLVLPVRAVEARKGRRTAAFSAFEAVTLFTEHVPDLLRVRNNFEIHTCGLATDFCVDATNRDAAAMGFRVITLYDLCAAVVPNKVDEIYEDYSFIGIDVLKSTEV